MREGLDYRNRNRARQSRTSTGIIRTERQKYLTLIMDINRHDTQLVIFDLRNRLILKRKVNIRLDDSTSFLKELFDATDDFLKSNNITRSELMGYRSIHARADQLFPGH